MTIGQLAQVRILEAASINIEDGIVKCVLITEGLGNLRDKNYYTKEALQDSIPLFNGVQCYLDHPAKDEEVNRPERSVRDLVGTFFDVEIGSIQINGVTVTALLAKLKIGDTEAGRIALELIKQSLEVAKQFPDKAFIGLSINATGESEPGTMNDMTVNMVKKFNNVFSVDIVTKPGARGGFREAASATVVTFIEKVAIFMKGKKLTEAQKQGKYAEEMRKLVEIKKAIANEVTPPGFEKVVKALKTKPEITNPIAVAWYMKNKGIEPKEAEAMVNIQEQMEALPESMFGILTLNKDKQMAPEVKEAMEALRPIMTNGDEVSLMEAAQSILDEKQFSHATIKRGTVKVTNPKQHALLHAKNLPHTDVYKSKTNKIYKIRKGT